MLAPPLRVFLDANVLVSASLSQKGPAYRLVHLVETGSVVGLTSVRVVEEAEGAVARLAAPAERELRRILGRARLKVRQPGRASIEAAGLCDAKDEHVLAAALHVRTTHLATFNVQDFQGRAIRERFGLQVVRPPDLVRTLVRLAK